MPIRFTPLAEFLSNSDCMWVFDLFKYLERGLQRATRFTQSGVSDSEIAVNDGLAFST